jgi:hypothetical protein
MTVRREHYAITLKAPNATRPTRDTFFQVYDLWIGPKRRVRRHRPSPDVEIRWCVPEYATWTLDTLRVVLHDLATFLPEQPDEEHVIAEVGDSPWDPATHLWICVSAPALDGNNRHRVEAGFTIDKTHLSEPMRAAIAALPHVPLKLSAIDCPESQGDDEMPAEALLAAAEQRLQRIVATLRDLASVDPTYVADIERLVGLIEETDR